MNTSLKVVAVLVVLGGIAGGAFLLRSQSPSLTENTENMQPTTTPETMEPIGGPLASSTIAAPSADIDDAVKAFDTELTEENNITLYGDADATTATDDKADVTSFSNTYGETDF